MAVLKPLVLVNGKIKQMSASDTLPDVNTSSGYSTTATAAGTTTLTVASAFQQYFTGSTTQTVVMPVTSTLVLGQSYQIINNSTGAVTVNSSGSNAIIVLAGGTSAILTCILTSGTTAASWACNYTGQSIASGKKLTVNNTIILAGTDGTTITLPSATSTVASLAGTETLTNKTITSPAINTPKLAIGTPSASLDGNGTIISGTAGETLAFGDLVYIKSDGKFWKAKGDAVATTPVVGMALAAITSGASGNILITGIARYDSWTWTIGGAIYLSTATSGGMTQTQPSTSGNQVQIIGFALSATNVLFQPNPIVIQI